jgi:DNA-binding SARP family transcriptional activator
MNTGDVIAPGSDLVHPGWVLNLPAGAGPAVSIEGKPFASPAPAEEVVVEEGDNFWELAEEQLESASGHLPTEGETAPYWQDMIEANEDRLVQPGNPNLILPGQKLCVPPVPGASPVGGPTETAVVVEEPAAPPLEVPPAEAQPVPLPTSEPEPVPTPPVTVRTPADLAPSAPSSADADTENPALPALATGLASAALAVGATRAVRHRRRRAAHRAPQSIPVPTNDGARAVHRALLAEADGVAVDDLRRCLGELAQAMAASGSATRPRIVQHSADHLDVYLNAPNTEAPSGWRADADGAVWSLRSSAAERNADAASICAAPLLVTLGQPDEGGQIYLDLEADGVISLAGQPDMARAVARSILTELAFTPLADTLEVMVIGNLAPPDAKALDHVTLANSWQDVREDLAAWAEQSHQVLLEKEWPNSFLGRGDDPYHDALAPVAVIAHEPPPSDLLDIVLANRPATLVVVAVGDMPGATVIDCTSDSLTIPDVGLVCTPYPLEEKALDAIIDMVESADDAGALAEGQLSLLASSLLVEPNPSGPDPETLVEPEYDVLVRTLGDIRVEGGDPLATKHAAAVAYIAIHGTVTADALEEAVWASSTGASRRKRMANTISECRALLGRKLLPTASDGRYKAGPGLMTDLELFDRRVLRAADQQPTDAADTLLSAMELVTGKLFNYRNADRSSFSWVDLENWVSRWEMKVAAVAQRCADLLLDVGRVDEAVDVALHALSVIPTHSALTESLMRAHAANGDRLAVQRVYQEHLGALESLDLDDAEASTTELCERLLDARTG